MVRHFLFLVLALSPLTVTADIDENSVLREVQEFYSGYVAAYTSQEADVLADNFLIAPVYFRNFEDVVFLSSRKEVVVYLGSVFSKMTDQDYESSEILASNVCILTDTSAIVSVAFRRYNSSGDVILESGASYSLFKFADRWRFTMLSTHPPENLVSCKA